MVSITAPAATLSSADQARSAVREHSVTGEELGVAGGPKSDGSIPPIWPESHLNPGLIAAASGRAQQAEKAYRTALRLDPVFAPGFVNLADLYRQQGREAEGEQVLRSGIEAVPENADLRHALGLLLVRNKQLDASLPYLRQAAELAGDNLRYAYVYALALKKAGNVAQALDVLDKANARRAGNRDILVALVNTHREQGNRQQAGEYASELVTRFPQDKQARALKQEVFEQE